MGKLDGKVAVVTGASSGIGLETARLFHAEGARLAIHGRDAERLDALAKELGGEALVVRGSVDKLSDIDALMAAVGDRFGAIDVLFCNAGIFSATLIREIDEELFDRMFAVNVKGSFFTMQKALPLLRKGASVIFNTTAMMHIGVPTSGAYVATKAAVRSLIRVMAAELGQDYRFNTISPGSIMTPLHSHSSAPPEMRDELAADIMKRTPQGRFGTADEIAKAALFLASDDSSYIQGEEIVVAGGWSAV